MSSSSRLTIIALDRDRLMRCDVDAKRGQSLGCWSRERPVGAELPSLVEMALRLGGKRAGTVWVLATDFWTQQLAVKPEKTDGLTPAETGRALAFEAESLSGISAIDSEVSYVPQRTDSANRLYWLLQVPTWLRDQIETAVRLSGAKLGGLLHPAGSPRPISTATAPQSWARLESWPGLLAGVGVRADGWRSTLLVNADPRSAAAQRQRDAWLQALGPVGRVEQLAQRAGALPDEPAVGALELDRQEVREAWLTSWAVEIYSGQQQVPVLRPPKRPMSVTRRVVLAASLAGAVLALCALDYLQLNWQQAVYKKTKVALQADTAAFQSSQKRAIELTKQIELLGAANAAMALEIDTAQNTFDVHRTRWLHLLEILSKDCPGDVWVHEIVQERDGLTLKGLCLGPDSASHYAALLEAELQPLGWAVLPAKKTMEQLPSEANVCRFSVALRDAAPTHPPRDASPAVPPEQPKPSVKTASTAAPAEGVQAKLADQERTIEGER